MQPITVNGIVTQYNGNGRKFGYPTANLDVSSGLKDGVYFGFADLAEFHGNPALIFVGIPTTVGDTERRVEVYLLGIPDQDYYGKNLTAVISHFHRPNQTFENLDQLMAAMKDDETAARLWFAKKPR